MNQEETEKRHRVWWDFSKFLKDKFGDLSDVGGADAIEAIEEYAKKVPEIRIVPCDDSHHSGSILVLVPHPEMGITVMFFPQLTTENNQFFLYPNHLAILQKNLEELAPVISWENRFKNIDKKD